MTDAQRIRQLEHILADGDDSINSKNLYEIIDALNELAWLLCDTDMKRAYALAETAYTLANSPSDDDPPYQIGMAYSLRTQGYLNMRFGNYSQGLAQLLRAPPLVETLQLYDGLPDVFDGIAGIYCLIGSYPEALDAAYKQLEAAQRIDDAKRVINAHNNLAVIYYETGDYERSKEKLHANLQLARNIKHTRIECITYINLAETYLFKDDYDMAVEYALCGLQMSQELSYELFEVHTLHTLGQCYLKMAEAPQAIVYLENAVALSQTVGSKTTEILALLTLGETYRDLDQIDQALAYVHQAITTAQSIEANKEIYQGHLLLSELYEQAGDLAQALVHFKEHQALKERVFNEKADERLKVLQVAHDTATAKQEAEIAHLRTVELQHEITKHRQTEQQLQRQLEYMRALSEFTQKLLASAEHEAESRRILTEAIHHLLHPTQARMIVIHQNCNDPELGLYSHMFVTVVDDVSESLQTADTYRAIAAEYREFLTQQLPGLSACSDEFISDIFPWSLIPPVANRQLMAGTWIGGPITELFADAPAFRDFLIQKLHLHSLLIFPIHIDGQWWGTITMSESVRQPTWTQADMAHTDSSKYILWTEDEILMLGTATEMIASALQRWQAQANLRVLNNQLEQQVVERTAKLRDTVDQLRAEIEERRRAEDALQVVRASLEQRLADRTQELATFFDLTVLGGRSADLRDVLGYALPRILEVTYSRAVCIHLFDTERQHLLLIAQQGLPPAFHKPMQTVELPSLFREWLGEPREPLLITDLSQLEIVPSAFRLVDFQMYLSVQIRVGQQIEGILSCYPFTDRGFGLDEIALVTAIGEQIGMVVETHRLRKQAAELAVLEERQRLARDLHDAITQSLYSLSLFSRAGREAVEDQDADRLQHSLSQIESTALHALREMRLLLYELRPADLKREGLKQAIELRLDMVERSVGLRVDVKMEDFSEMLYDYEIELYYIIVEAMNNVVKHAAATRLTLQLTHENGDLHVQIVDNGQGFDPSHPTGGFGLRNIRERVTRLNGNLAIFSEPKRGTKLEVVIPF